VLGRRGPPAPGRANGVDQPPCPSFGISDCPSRGVLGWLRTAIGPWIGSSCELVGWGAGYLAPTESRHWMTSIWTFGNIYPFHQQHSLPDTYHSFYILAPAFASCSISALHSSFPDAGLANCFRVLNPLPLRHSPIFASRQQYHGTPRRRGPVGCCQRRCCCCGCCAQRAAARRLHPVEVSPGRWSPQSLVSRRHAGP
jgi:hypothetical protein